MKFIISIITFLFMLASPAFALKIVTSSGAGSQGDTVARVLTPALEKGLNRSVTVINALGGSGVVAAQTTANSTDPYTVLIGGTWLGYNKATIPNLNLDLMNDFEPLVGLTDNVLLVYVPTSSNIYSLADLKKFQTSNGRLLVGSNFATVNLVINAMSKSMNMPLEIVNYKVQSEMIVQVVGGFTHVFLGSTGNLSAQPLIDAGKIRAIAVLGDKRARAFPDIKTISEQGFDSVGDIYNWTAIFVNKSTPENVKKELIDAFSNALISPEAKQYEGSPGRPQLWQADRNEIRKKQLREFEKFK